jgi:hypothetical protein
MGIFWELLNYSQEIIGEVAIAFLLRTKGEKFILRRKIIVGKEVCHFFKGAALCEILNFIATVYQRIDLRHYLGNGSVVGYDAGETFGYNDFFTHGSGF